LFLELQLVRKAWTIWQAWHGRGQTGNGTHLIGKWRHFLKERLRMHDLDLSVRRQREPAQVLSRQAAVL
jgi:hypothetical protein